MLIDNPEHVTGVLTERPHQVMREWPGRLAPHYAPTVRRMDRVTRASCSGNSRRPNLDAQQQLKDILVALMPIDTR